MDWKKITHCIVIVCVKWNAFCTPFIVFTLILSQDRKRVAALGDRSTNEENHGRGLNNPRNFWWGFPLCLQQQVFRRITKSWIKGYVYTILNY